MTHLVSITTKSPPLSDLSSILARIQEEEAAKLEMTAAHQIARQTLLEQEMKRTETTTTTTTSGSGEERDAEMTRREIADLKRRLAENEATINELLEELKYQSEDLYEEEEEEEEEEGGGAAMEESVEAKERTEGLDAREVNIEMEELSR